MNLTEYVGRKAHEKWFQVDEARKYNKSSGDFQDSPFLYDSENQEGC